jgi:hypothetical protein
MDFNRVICLSNGKYFQKWNQILFLKEKHYKKFASSIEGCYKKNSKRKLRSNLKIL